jgi:hypothetical protein
MTQKIKSNTINFHVDFILVLFFFVEFIIDNI